MFTDTGKNNVTVSSSLCEYLGQFLCGLARAMLSTEEFIPGFEGLLCHMV